MGVAKGITLTEPIFVLRGQNNDVFDELREVRDPALLTNWVFWNFWKRRHFPYKTIEEGQTLYLVDTKAREIGAELRVSAVARVQYEDPQVPYRVLEQSFGIGSEAAETGLDRREMPIPGYLLAVAVDPVAYLGTPIELDWSKVGGRAGWAAWRTVLESDHASQGAKAALRGLPAEGRPPAAKSYPVDLGAVGELDPIPRAPRHPTPAVARRVRSRAQGRCEMVGCDAPAEHLDHIYPWAHGGNSDFANLQWLCARHNLQKSDRIPETFTAEQLWLRYVSDLGDETITIGNDLAAHEIRTRNSTYDLVVDGDVLLLTKRGSRDVFVEAFDGMESVVANVGDGRRIEIQGNPECEEPLFTSSPVEDIKPVEPSVALARIGRRVGDTITLGG